MVPCLGININIRTGTLSIPPDKLKTVVHMCHKWQTKNTASKTQLQSLVGSLIYIHKCVKPPRLFINRMLAILRAASERGLITLSQNVKDTYHGL